MLLIVELSPQPHVSVVVRVKVNLCKVPSAALRGCPQGPSFFNSTFPGSGTYVCVHGRGRRPGVDIVFVAFHYLKKKKKNYVFKGGATTGE